MKLTKNKKGKPVTKLIGMNGNDIRKDVKRFILTSRIISHTRLIRGQPNKTVVVDEKKT